MSEGVVSNICAPALVYLCFSLIQIIIDMYKKQFYTAFFKFWTMLIFTTLLNILCERGLSVVSWMFVFVPIITMTILLVILIYFLGFNPGQINKKFNISPNAIQPPPDESNNLAEIIRKEIELQKKNDPDILAPDNAPDNAPDKASTDPIVKLNEAFTGNRKHNILSPFNFT